MSGIMVASRSNNGGGGPNAPRNHHTAADERAPLLDQRANGPGGGYSATGNVPDVGKAGGDGHYNLVGLSTRSFWVLCISMWTCSFLNAFDGTVVATLLGPISSSFYATNLASWLGTAYMLSVCSFTPIYGRLCNIIGRQASMQLAVGIFTLGTVLCAIAPNMWFLIIARAIAGMGGGGVSTTGSTIMSDIVPISYRGIFQGYGNIAFGLGMGLGAPIGGLVNDYLGWRFAFYIQIPVMAVASFLIYLNVRYDWAARSLQGGGGGGGGGPGSIAASGTTTPTARPSAKALLKRIDFMGCFLLAGWVGCALLAISLKTNSTDVFAYKWSDPTILGLFGASFVLFLVFLFVELKFAAEPVMPFELLHKRTPVAVAVNNFVLSILAFGTMYTIPLFLTAVRQLSASAAGRRMIPGSVMGMFGSLGCGFYVRHVGRYYWLNTFMGLFAIVSTILLSTWTTETPDWVLWVSNVPMSLAMGSVTTLTIVALIADVGPSHVAVATSLSYVSRTIGQVLGVSLSGALTQAVLQSELRKRITGENASEIILKVRQSSASIRDLDPIHKAQAILSYRNALHAVFVVCGVLAVVALLAGMGIKEIDLKAPKAVKQPVDEEDSD